MTKTVGLTKRHREPGMVGTGTSTWALKITSEQQAESGPMRVRSDDDSCVMGSGYERFRSIQYKVVISMVLQPLSFYNGG